MRKNKLLSVERSKEAIELGFTQTAFGKSFLTLTPLEWHAANNKHRSKLSLQPQREYGMQRRFLLPFLCFFQAVFEEDYSYVKTETARFIITLSQAFSTGRINQLPWHEARTSQTNVMAATETVFRGLIH